ncbi:MAG TPA: hypothetical protein VIY49_29605 [Bryobacteraceae bacterium]
MMVCRPQVEAYRAYTLALILSIFAAQAHAQGRGRGPAGPPPTPKAAAPVDLTGNWVSIVTEDWRWRMVTPPKGDYAGVPLNAEGRKVADAWDPTKDEAAGEQCKSYGAAGLMRLPGRVHIHWENESTLQVDTDAGTQTRTFHFGASPAAAGQSWQGISVSNWKANWKLGRVVVPLGAGELADMRGSNNGGFGQGVEEEVVLKAEPGAERERLGNGLHPQAQQGVHDELHGYTGTAGAHIEPLTGDGSENRLGSFESSAVAAAE